MSAAVVTGVFLLLVTVVNAVVAFLTRNERAVLNQEIDAWLKLDPASDTAKKLREVMNYRVTRWHQKVYRQKEGKQIQRLDFSAIFSVLQVGLGVTAVVVAVLLLTGVIPTSVLFRLP